MVTQRYPYLPAGKAAAAVFALCGGVAGEVLALRVWTTLAAATVVCLYGGLIGAAAFVVFASQGRQQRPTSVTQASIADGLIAGVIGAASASVVCVLIAGGAGSSHGPSLGDIVVSFLGGILGGAVGGAILGYVVLVVAGRERLQREPPGRSRRRQSRRSDQRRKR